MRRTKIAMNLNNQIDWSDTDRIVSNDVRFVMLEGDWWRESSSWQTRQNGSYELTLMGRTRTRLTGDDALGAPQTGDTTVGGVIPNAPQQGDTTRWLYDEPSGCMTNKLYADGKGPSYSYTPDGKLARRTWARGISTDYTYDNAGNLTRTEYNDDGVTPTITMAYDRVGNLTEAATAGIVTNLYANDIYGHCTNEWQNDFNLTRYYDALGRSTGYAINGERQTTIAYDSYGRVATMSVPATAPEEDEQHHCPPPPLLSTFSWTYLQGSDLKQSLTYPNGLTASWTYDANNQLLQVRNATPTNVISQFDYIYDAAGRRTAIAKSGSAFGDLSGSIDSYTYNARSELTSARRTKNGQPIPGFSEDFDYDPIGNRRSSATYNEKGEAQASTYVANNLNQYTTRTTPGYAAVRGEADPNATVTVNENPTFRLGSYYFGSDLFDNTSDSGLANLETYAVKEGVGQGVGVEGEDIVSDETNQVYIAQSPETFAYDDDGNQTLITTKTGLWRVTYNGENRPIRWENLAPESNNQTISNQTILSMSYDHMCRRREKNAQRFFYDGYLQVTDTFGNAYTWNPTERVATRPLAWCRDSVFSYYAHDGNKNVSEVLGTDDTIAAHYEYAPFGAVVAQRGSSAAASPWRFSSEYAEDEMSAAYYNYRHLEPTKGRWMSMDCVEDGANRYNFVGNIPNVSVDIRGQRKRSMTYISDQPGFNFAEFLSDALFISEDTESPHDFQPNKLLGKCDCIEILMIMIHGRATRNNERAVVQWGDTELVESSSKQEISDMFKGIRFCNECTLELRSCNIGNSLYLKDRLVEKTGCRIILYDRKVYLFELQVEEEE